MRTRNLSLLLSVSAAAMILAAETRASGDAAPPPPSSAPSADAGANLEEIVVTAQKRSENINDVGMAITAVSGATLLDAGVRDTSGLTRIDPSFVYVPSSYGTPVYSIRGVGFYDTALGATPAVTVYLDQVPIPYSIMTSAASMDVERVEILKGPQGTLFGENATGGAINYIANKPTDYFTTGGDLSYGRFDSVDFDSYVSGPIAPTLSARLAVRVDHSGPWQESYTRSDELGDVNRGFARILLDWQPNDQLKAEFNVNGGIDRSETQAGQLLAVTFPFLAPDVVNYPLSPQNARAADWDPAADPHRHDSQFQVAANVAYEFKPDLVLRSIMTYQYYDLDARSDDSGMDHQIFTAIDTGWIRSFSEELRLEGNSFDERMSWLFGSDFSRDRVFDSLGNEFPDGRYGLAGIESADAISDQKASSISAFGNTEFKLSDQLSAQFGARYTSSARDFVGCTHDSGDGTYAAYVNKLLGQPGLVAPGGCATLNPMFQPAPVISRLAEDNVSWRTGLNWTVVPGSLLYASVSKGYKDGDYPTAGATASPGLAPAKQEALLAYELGFKLSLADHTLQLNGATFYYAYTDKQVRGRIIDPIFGSFNRLINIPRSHETGAELEVKWRPVNGLTLSAGGTYLDSRIDGNFVNLDALGAVRNLTGEPYSYTPTWSGIAGIDYRHSVGRGLIGFATADVNYQSSSYAGLGEVPLFELNARALLNLRAGVESPSGAWNVAVWADNVTNKYYWNNVLSVTGDDVIRYAGMPVTMGISVGWKL
jgi:outer membrane receptor protein involved in Fe transport